MPIKDPEKRRASMRAWYARTKHKRTPELVQRQTGVKRARRQELIAWFAEMKETLSCRRCGESHPACLQFHHRDPAEKEIMLAIAIRRAWSKKRILAEAAKCEVLCANCHAKHHARSAGMSKKWRETNRERQNELWRRWYRANAARKRGWEQARRVQMRTWWRELKATKHCEQCGECAPECLHFHHVDPATKLFELGEAASLGRAKEVILAELEKCRVLCANCHLKHHWNERKGSG